MEDIWGRNVWMCLGWEKWRKVESRRIIGQYGVYGQNV